MGGRTTRTTEGLADIPQATQAPETAAGAPQTVPESATRESTYVVQQLVEVDVVTKWSTPDHNQSPTPAPKPLEWEKREVLVDIAMVVVPANTQRKTVYQKALDQAGIKPAADTAPPELRALDAASAAVVKMGLSLEWKVGG